MKPKDSVKTSNPSTEKVTSTPSTGAPIAVNDSIIFALDSYDGSAKPPIIGKNNPQISYTTRQTGGKERINKSTMSKPVHKNRPDTVWHNPISRWLKTKQFWSVPFVSDKKRKKYLKVVENDIKKDLKL